ncbi:hypothetical protein OG905_00545 [Streptomyces sp. NBC_00322]|uniref:effector-associated constant component EACC1 n=1 Tax=Streptomyces sp. NBC_00322 TaxID=2975712 RepID=UPI002E2D1B41|nr:hypothetical protein [Streptomyces sp. NBC_00322]
MKVLLGIVGDEDGAQIRSLADWLRDDESVPTVATVEATPDPAEMGPVTDAIALVLQPAGLMTAVVGAVAAWLGTRGRETTIRVRTDDREIEIVAFKLADPEQVALRILRELDQS